jgi:hypothetical protein
MLDAPYDTIGLTASGKNIVTVGAVDSEKAIASFSGRGPAKDGRVKPDLVARGVNVFSTTTNSSYGRKSGTSMSTPVVTGITALLAEQWHRTFNNATPTPEQLKALLIAGADDLGNTGPDYTYGYGFANAKASVDLIRDDAGQAKRIRTSSLAQDEHFDTAVVVASPQKLRVVLQWLDPEIAFLGDDEIAAKALVNDLDLTVTDPAGNVVLPWVLNPGSVTTTASRGVNTRDNTEEVEIANATAGTYRISVVAKSITDKSPQSFTLVANATLAQPCVDNFESNDSTSTAYGDLSPGAVIGASLCSASDVDFFRFSVTKPGTVTVTVNATGDTQVRATATPNGGASSTVDVAAGQSRTLSFNVAAASVSQPVKVIVKFEPIGGSVGLTPTYTFSTAFPQTVLPRRRAVR